jgi:outer membrane protein
MTTRSIPSISLLVLAAALVALPARADSTDIGYVDQAALASLPMFVQANRTINDYGQSLQRQYQARARRASQAQQAKLVEEFQSKMADEQRKVLGPVFGKAQVAIANVASSKNLSIVVDKRILIVGGEDITGDVRTLLTGVGDPVPPVSTPPPSTIGFVDQRAIDALPSVKSATDDFTKFKAHEDFLAAQKMRAAKSDSDRSAVLKDYQKTLQDKQQASLKPLVDKTKNAISDVARKKNLVLVVDRQNVIYGGTDITADVTAEIK